MKGKKQRNVFDRRPGTESRLAASARGIQVATGFSASAMSRRPSLINTRETSVMATGTGL